MIERSSPAVVAGKRRRRDSRVVSGDGNKLLDEISIYLGAANDAELCRKLEVRPSLASKIRHGRSVGAQLLIRVHEVTGLSIRDLRALMGDMRPRFEGGE